MSDFGNTTKFGCAANFIAVVRQFHNGMLARFKIMTSFLIHSLWQMEVQYYVLAPTLFSIMFSAVLTYAFLDDDNGIHIRYHFDGKPFNLRKLQAKSKVQIDVLDDSSLMITWKGCFNRRNDAKRCGSRVWFMWQLWSPNQHQNDWGGISASTWKALPTRSLPWQRKVNDCKW